MKITSIALIPAYEPDTRLINLVKELKENDFDILIVDDGSGSKYQSIFKKCQDDAHIISYNQNRGKGYALKTGLKYIKENYNDSYIIVTVDSDGQHTVIDAKKLTETSKENINTLYLGKRIRNNKIPIRSRIGNGITRFIYKKTSGLDVYDTQTGLRAFSHELVDYLINIPGDRFEYEMNVLLKCSKDKVLIKEIEITTIYIDNNSGSHFNFIKDSYRIYKDIIKFIMKDKK